MRNLKKILALVLALVMSLSLMATAGAADFTDASSISDRYETAVNVLEGLKVFKGYAEDNTFRPQGDITRAEVATIIYRIATGDVEDAQASIYTNMTTSFTDLDQAEWARGYVNYSHNAQIIKGEGGGKFNPNGKISGYATLAMILRTIGYGKNGEFEGGQWEIMTAAKAKEIGLIDNVMEAQLGSNASREMVAEILFRGLLVETVTYNALTGYVPTGKTLGKNVGLEDVVGVVIANEWANLEGNKPLKEGTLLKVDGKNRTIDVSTSGADIGTSVHVYLKGEKVLADVEPSAKNVIKTNEGDAALVRDLKGTLDVTNAEHFVNYGTKQVKNPTSDWRLEYRAPDAVLAMCGYTGGNTPAGSTEWLVPDADGNDVHMGWKKVIRANTVISDADLDIMEEIFAYDDAKVAGEVYAGTHEEDLSNEITWKTFRTDYLNLGEDVKITEAAQGESLRIIDNNGDGKADYVLLVQFVMTTVKDYDKTTDSYLVEHEEYIDRISGGEMISASAIKAMDGEDAPDLSNKAVILYAKVDGVYYTTNPVVETWTIDKKGIDTKNATFTVDGEKHVWSGIFETAAYYYTALKELAENSKYNFYLDYFGNARLASEVNKGFVLLTDGFYWSNRRAEEKKAELYDDESGELIEVDVVDYKPSTYPDGYFVSETWSWGDDNDKVDDAWLRLRFFQHIYNGKSSFTTNVAAFATDGETYSLFNVTDKTATPDLTRNKGYNAYEIAGTKAGYAAKDQVTVKPGDVGFTDTELYGIETWNDDGTVTNLRRIQTTSNTQYYFVTRDYTAKNYPAIVISWVGYKNVPAELNGETPLLAYAVTYASTSTSNYDVAEVVVFEEIDWEVAKDAWLVFAARSNTSLEYSLGVDPDGSGEYGDYYTKLGVFKGLTGLKSAGTLEGPYKDMVLKFYDVYGEQVTKDFADYGIYVGTINTRQDVDYQDYITFGEGKRVDKRIATADDLVEYRFIFDSTEAASRINGVDAGRTTRLHDGDHVIYMLNGKGEIALIINLDDSIDEYYRHIDLENIPALWNEDEDDLGLYQVIEKDAEDSLYYTLTVVDGDEFGMAVDPEDEADEPEAITRIRKGTGSMEILLLDKDGGEFDAADVADIEGADIKALADGIGLLTDIEDDVVITLNKLEGVFGNLASRDETIVTVGDGDGKLANPYEITVASGNTLATVVSRLCMVDGTVHGGVKAYIKGYQAYDALRKTPVDGKILTNGMWIELRVEDLKGVTTTIWTVVATDDEIAESVLTVTVSAGVKAYWVYENENSSNNVSVEMKTPTTFEVAAGASVKFVAEGVGSFSKTGNLNGLADYGQFTASSGKVMTVGRLVVNEAGTVTFNPAEPEEPETLTIDYADDTAAETADEGVAKVTWPETVEPGDEVELTVAATTGEQVVSVKWVQGRKSGTITEDEDGKWIIPADTLTGEETVYISAVVLPETITLTVADNPAVIVNVRYTNEDGEETVKSFKTDDSTNTIADVDPAKTITVYSDEDFVITGEGVTVDPADTTDSYTITVTGDATITITAPAPAEEGEP